MAGMTIGIQKFVTPDHPKYVMLSETKQLTQEALLEKLSKIPCGMTTGVENICTSNSIVIPREVPTVAVSQYVIS